VSDVIKRKLEKLLSKDLNGFSIDNLVMMLTRHDKDIEDLKERVKRLENEE